MLWRKWFSIKAADKRHDKFTNNLFAKMGQWYTKENLFRLFIKPNFFVDIKSKHCSRFRA